MAPTFRLHWLRESGCDTGTFIRADELDPAILGRVTELAEDDQDLALHLPFLDRREWKKRSEMLAPLEFFREGNEIRYVLGTSAHIRDHAATVAMTDPNWSVAPREREARYFPTWQRVALALQRALRSWVPEFYFRDASVYEDREAAYPLVVYEASRICYGRPRTEFTYDISDEETLPLAFRAIGRSLQTVLEGIERRLHADGRPELARRYAPIWHEDVLAAVRQKPKRFIGILADEAALVNAVIDLGTVRNAQGVRRFSRAANLALQCMYDVDMRTLAVKALDEATRCLAANRQAPRLSRSTSGSRTRTGQLLSRPSDYSSCDTMDRADHVV